MVKGWKWTTGDPGSNPYKTELLQRNKYKVNRCQIYIFSLYNIKVFKHRRP